MMLSRRGKGGILKIKTPRSKAVRAPLPRAGLCKRLITCAYLPALHDAKYSGYISETRCRWSGLLRLRGPDAVVCKLEYMVQHSTRGQEPAGERRS
jgi:hypothetical protein